MECKFCGGELNENDMICSVCGKPVEKKKICPQCHTEHDQDAAFCNKCGWNFGTGDLPHKFCPKCGNELKVDSKFCNKCGYDFSSKPKVRKKKPFVLIAVVVIIIVGCAVGGTVYYKHQKAVKEALEAERQRQELIASYQKKAVEVRNAIQEAKANFDILSIMFSTSTSLNVGLFGPSFYTSYTEGLCSAEITEEKNRKREIDSLYEELDEIECEEEEIKELKKAIEDYYYSYCDRYDLLIDMNFSTSNFDSKDQTSSSDFSAKEKTVNAIISQIEFDRDTDADTSEENGRGNTT